MVKHKMVLFCGLPGTGKTTRARIYAEEQGYEYYGIDEYYLKVNGDDRDRKNFFGVWMKLWEDLHEAEIHEKNVVVDVGAILSYQRDQFVDWFPNFRHILVYFEASKDLIVESNKNRSRSVPFDVLENKMREYQVASAEGDFRWDEIYIVKNLDNENFEKLRVK